mmetsp:Transcript_324/g.707  ORF Transcript_324/g.707 Transcript_324/m.707 type:complete len:80 (+) Transcript_324:947-1186(+)
MRAADFCPPKRPPPRRFSNVIGADGVDRRAKAGTSLAGLTACTAATARSERAMLNGKLLIVLFLLSNAYSLQQLTDVPR